MHFSGELMLSNLGGHDVFVSGGSPVVRVSFDPIFEAQVGMAV